MKGTTLSSLPTEVLFCIKDRLTSLRDLGVLCLTCKELNTRLSPVLYGHGLLFDDTLFLSACGDGGNSRIATVSHLIAAGADPARQQFFTLKRGTTRDSSPASETTGDEPCCRWNSAELEEWRETGGAIMYSPLWHRRAPGLAKWGQQLDIELGTRYSTRMREIDVVDEHQTKDALKRVMDETDKFYVSWSAMHIAAWRGHVGILKVLTECEANQGGKLVNSLAAGYGTCGKYEPSIGRRNNFLVQRRKTVKEILHALPQSDLWTLHTPLRAAICAQEEDAAIFLIDNGANLHFTGPNGEHEHALHVAALYGCDQVTKHIWSKSDGTVTDIDISDSDGWTPLCMALLSERIDIPSLLISLGADVNHVIPGSGGMRPLHLACWKGDWSHATTLLRAGAYTNAIWTPRNFPADISYHGPFRAIDLVCLQNHEYDARNTNTSYPRQRKKLLSRLMETYGADTGPCPGSEISPSALAATLPDFNYQTVRKWTLPVEMLQTLSDAGVLFHRDPDLIDAAFSAPLRFHHKGNGHTETTVDVVSWLVRHGVRVNTEPSEVVFAGVLKTLADAAGSRYGRPRMSMAMVALLVKRGGMDVNLSSTKHKAVRGGNNCSLFRAVLRIDILRRENVEAHIEIGDALATLGAKPPTVLQALEDLSQMLPGLSRAEIKDYLAARGEEHLEDSEPNQWNQASDDDDEDPIFAVVRAHDRHETRPENRVLIVEEMFMNNTMRHVFNDVANKRLPDLEGIRAALFTHRGQPEVQVHDADSNNIGPAGDEELIGRVPRLHEDTAVLMRDCLDGLLEHRERAVYSFKLKQAIRSIREHHYELGRVV